MSDSEAKEFKDLKDKVATVDKWQWGLMIGGSVVLFLAAGFGVYMFDTFIGNIAGRAKGKLQDDLTTLKKTLDDRIDKLDAKLDGRIATVEGNLNARIAEAKRDLTPRLDGQDLRLAAVEAKLKQLDAPPYTYEDENIVLLLVGEQKDHPLERRRAEGNSQVYFLKHAPNENTATAEFKFPGEILAAWYTPASHIQNLNALSDVKVEIVPGLPNNCKMQVQLNPPAQIGLRVLLRLHVVYRSPPGNGVKQGAG
jgi:hypothetical protein